MSNCSDFFNGAKCNSYCWSQNHSDLEIRIKLTRPLRYEEVDVSVSNDRIKVVMLEEPHQNPSRRLCKAHSKYCLLEGSFEHQIDTSSVYWLLDKQDCSILIYLDKLENRWWKELLINEAVNIVGNRNYTIPLESMSEESRMVVERMIMEQRNKNI